MTVHPFEQRGLGVAPFRVVGVEERRGPLRHRTESGAEILIGAPGQPMGTCDYCGTSIAECWSIRSADGKRFVVGCDCVRKTGDAVQVRQGNREARKLLVAREEARIAVTSEHVRTTGWVRVDLASLPHPNPTMAARGADRLGWAEWMLSHAGHAGKMRVVREVDRLLKEHAE